MVSRLSEQPLPQLVKQGRVGEKRLIVTTLVACLLGLVLIQVAIRTGGLGILTPLMAVGGAVLLIASWRRWEFGVQSLLIILIAEGAIRKWLMPSASDMVYFYKDVLMVVILLAYLTEGKKAPLVIRGRLGLFSSTVVVFVSYAVTALMILSVAAMVSPDRPHALVGLLGFKAYCLYIPLAFLVPRMFTDKEKLVRFLKWYSLIVLPVAILGAMQFTNLDPSSSINKYAQQTPGGVAQIASFYDSSGTHYVRVTGTFSYVSGLTTYLPTMFALLLGLVSLHQRDLSALVKWIYYAAVGAVVVVTFMTGSRAPVLLLIFIALTFYGFTSIKNLFRRLVQIGLLGGVIFAGVYLAFPQALDAFRERAFGGEETIEEGLSRIADPFRLPLDEMYYAGATGYGIGTTQNAVPALMRTLNPGHSGNLVPFPTEGEQGRVMLELGVVGYLLYMVFRVALIITICQVCFSIRDPKSKPIALGILGALIGPLLLGGAIVSHTQNVYQWFLVGAMFALLNAERLEIKSKRAEAMAAFEAAR